MKKLEEHLALLRVIDQSQVELAKNIMQADGGKFYSIDLVFLAAVNRSRSNIDAFIRLIECENYLAAIPFIRMQLDTVFRLYALRLVDDPDSLSHEILKGLPLNKKKDKKGERLSDAYLRAQVAKHEEWIDAVYASGSGFIHLSEKHILSLFAEVEEKGSFQMMIGSTQKHIPVELRKEAVVAMSHITELIMGLSKEWASRNVAKH